MVSSPALTVDEYLAELPDDRAAVVSQVRDLVNRALPDGYEEGMQYGMVTWRIPLEVCPDTYNGEPLAYVSLAAQKHHYALYLMGMYATPGQEARLRERWQARGARLDMGRSCLRFRRLADLQEDLVAEVIAAMTPDQLVAATARAHGAKGAGRKRSSRSSDGL